MAKDVRKARWIGIALVLVFGGIVAGAAAALPGSAVGLVLAFGVLAIIVLLALSRFLPDSAFGGRVGRARARSQDN